MVVHEKALVLIARGVASGGGMDDRVHRAQRSYDRLLAIGSTGTFPSSSRPIAEMRVTSPILGAVLKLQSMQNHIKQILQKREVFNLFIYLLQLKALWPIKKNSSGNLWAGWARFPKCDPGPQNQS